MFVQYAQSLFLIILWGYRRPYALDGCRCYDVAVKRQILVLLHILNIVDSVCKLHLVATQHVALFMQHAMRLNEANPLLFAFYYPHNEIGLETRIYEEARALLALVAQQIHLASLQLLRLLIAIPHDSVQKFGLALV